MARWLGLFTAAFMPTAGAIEAAVLQPVEDDHGTGIAATLLPIGQPLAGTLSDPGDVDAFRLDLAAAARVEVRTSGGTDTRGRLLDSDGEVVARDDNSGPGGHNFRMVAALEAGVHYLEVAGAAGDFWVTARLADALDQGDRAASSMVLMLHETGNGAAATADIRLGAPGRIWPSAADVDVFRLDVPRDGTDVTIRSSGHTALRARLIDSALAEVVSGEGRGNIRMNRRLDAGTYYLAIGGDETGPYRLLATGVPTNDPCMQPALPRDDGNTPESSTLLAVGGPSRAGMIADDADVDVFRLDLVGDAQVEVRTTGGTDTRGELYDSTGAPIASDQGSGPGGHNFRVVVELAAGIYYAAVSGAPGARGEYAVVARVGGMFDHADVPTTSTRLPLHGADDLARVFPDMLLGTAGRIWPKTDEDVFRLDVSRDGTVARLRTSGGTRLYAHLLHAGEELVEVASDDSDGNVHIEAPLDAGVYYLRIGGHDTGAYRVLASGYEPGFAPADKAAFDALAAGKWLFGPSLETVVFGSARRFELREVTRRGRYTYERGACPDAGWLAFEYDDGGRCEILLSFDSVDRGVATYSCVDGSRGTSRFSIMDGEAEAYVPDRNLARSIRRALGRSPSDYSPVTVADMASLRSLDESRVRDLTGLDLAMGLTRLRLRHGEISDLSPLSRLTSLEYLSLAENAVADLEPLAGLTALNSLSLWRNDVSDLKPLIGLTALTHLDLGGNAVVDLQPLASLTTLDSLYLGANAILNIEPLAGLTALTRLSLASNGISDLEPLAALTALVSLSLHDNRISDLGPLARLTSLKGLGLGRNGISDVQPVSGLTQLTHLGLSHNEVWDLEPLAGLAALSHLDLGYNRISDLRPLAGLTKLRDLFLSDNAISDPWPLEGLTQLDRLRLRYNRISDLKPLAGLSPTQLDLEGNRVSDLTPLSGAALSRSGRVFLDLSDNDISNVAALSGLAFSELDLAHNEISDLSPIAGMTLADDWDFHKILLQGNRISDASPLDPLTSVTALRYGGTIDLGHNAISEVPSFDHLPSEIDLAGNRITSLGWRLAPRYYLNIEGNALDAVPSTNSGDLSALYLAGNRIRDLAPLVADARTFVYPVVVSLWRNPLSALARESQLPELRSHESIYLAGRGHLVPLLVGSSGLPRPDRRGVLRLVSMHVEGDAWLYAPRLGDAAQAAAVVVPEGWAVHLDAEDIRRGARDKRVYGQLPIGPGDAVLEVHSSNGIRAYAYVRSDDGFLTSVHDVASVDADRRHVLPMFNPANNTGQTSLLRLVNMDGDDTHVSVAGIDDAGVVGGPVRLVLPARTAVVLDALSLESGSGAGLSGRLGDGKGKWRLEVTSDGHIAVMSLLENPTGHLTNLSTSAPANTVPLFLSASHPRGQGWVRVVNRGGDTDVVIRGIDDAGSMVGPLTVPIAADQALTFNSHDWENGNASKGLVRGAGSGNGDWRLEFESPSDILVGAYVETEDGFLSSIHDQASPVDEPTTGCGQWWHRWDRPCRASAAVLFTVAPFMPPSDDGLVSSLRLLNDGDEDAMVTIWGIDERGSRSGPVDLVLAAATARTVTARELTGGGEGLAGWLRARAGTWELLVASSVGRVSVVNLLEDASGHIANLSTAPHHPVADPYR